MIKTRNYQYNSFISLNLIFTEFSGAVDIEEMISVKEIPQKMRRDGLAAIKDSKPRIIKETGVTVDGHAGKFMQLETNQGDVTRLKYFVVKNRMYNLFVTVKKGEKHGFNCENNFEKPALAFLDSITIIVPKGKVETF